jgi:hypothetical protein
MLPHRISVKYFLTAGSRLDLTAVTPIFHRWIQGQCLPGLLIDVTDYQHIPHGPGIILMGHEGDYALDLADGRPGLLYRHKREWPAGALAQRLRPAVQRAMLACRLLASDPVLAGRLAFDAREIEITLADRLQTPNLPETFTAVVEPVQAALSELYPGLEFQLAPVGLDAKRPLAIRVQVSGAAIGEDVRA